MAAGIAHSVQQLATGWTVWESKLGESEYVPSRPALELTQPPVQWVPRHTRGLNCRGVALSPISFQCRDANGLEIHLRIPLCPGTAVKIWRPQKIWSVC